MLPWVIGAIAAAGVAWLAMSLLTFLTSYPVLRVSGWQIATSGAARAKLSFSVFNDGNEAATDCHAGVRLEDGRLLSRAAPAVPMHRTKVFVVQDREFESRGTHRAYLWARCGAAITARTAIHAPPDVLLIVSAPVCTTPNIRIVSTRVPVPSLPARALNLASSKI